MNIGGKRISDTDYLLLLKRLCAHLEEAPIRGALIYNIIYDLVSSRPSYEARLYQDLCRFLHNRIKRGQEYLPGFAKYKTLALALSGLCSLLHDTLGNKYRRLDDMAFLIWERIMLRDKDIGAWLVREIISEVTAENLFGHRDVDACGMEAICREVCFGQCSSLPEHLLETLKSEESTVLKDCILGASFPHQGKDIHFSDERHTGSASKGIHTELAYSGAPGAGSFAFYDSELSESSTFLEIGMYGAEEVVYRCSKEASVQCETPGVGKCAVAVSGPYNISYTNIREYLETLTYVVPDPSSPLLYYIITYELKALTRIACEASMPSTSFDIYTSFAYMKLSSEMKRMGYIFLEHSYPKLLRTLDHVLIVTRKEWLQDMLRTVLDEPLLLRKYFRRLRLFPSFKLIFTGVFEEFLKKFIERHTTKNDLGTMYGVLNKMTSYTETYLSTEWLDVVRLTFSRYLNGVKCVAAIFVKFTESMLAGKHNIACTDIHAGAGSLEHAERHADAWAASRHSCTSRGARSKLYKDALSRYLRSTEWAVFNELFALLESKCEFSELYVLSLHERLLKNPDIVQERMLLDVLVDRGCSAEFKRRVETMIADIEESPEYVFEVTPWLTRYIRGTSQEIWPRGSPCNSSQAAEDSAACGVMHGGLGFFGHVRNVEFPETGMGLDRAVPETEGDGYIAVRPHILNSGTWSFPSHNLSLPMGLAHILSFFESKLRLNRRKRYFSWIHDKSTMVVEIMLGRRVVVVLNTLQYCILDCVAEKSTAEEVSRLCGCDRMYVEQTLRIFLESGLVVQETSLGETQEAASANPGLHSTSSPETAKYYMINTSFDRPFVQITDNTKTAKQKRPADLKQACQSMICGAMKQKKSLCYNDLLGEVGNIDRDFFDGALNECVIQGYLEKNGSMYRYIP